MNKISLLEDRIKRLEFVEENKRKKATIFEHFFYNCIAGAIMIGFVAMIIAAIVGNSKIVLYSGIVGISLGIFIGILMTINHNQEEEKNE